MKVGGWWVAVLACASLGLLGCKQADTEWKRATTTNTVAAYENFARMHPDDTRRFEARRRIRALQDDAAWASAEATNTVDGYSAYLHDHTGGVHFTEADAQITSLERGDAWQSAKNQGTGRAFQSFLDKYPGGPEADQARKMLRDLNFRVQLAEARSEAAAARLRDRLQKRFGDVVHELVVVPPSGTKSDYTVTSAPMSQGDAISECTVLERSHQNCKLVHLSPVLG